MKDDVLNDVSVLKGLGYLTSTLSVVLLGIVSLKSASEQPLLAACLLAGMATSVLGMVLRWRSHRLDQREKSDKSERQAAQDTRVATTKELSRAS